jgi:hypothetical protein
VANATGQVTLEVPRDRAARVGIETDVETHPLEDANAALARLAAGEVSGTAARAHGAPGLTARAPCAARRAQWISGWRPALWARLAMSAIGAPSDPLTGRAVADADDGLRGLEHAGEVDRRGGEDHVGRDGVERRLELVDLLAP